MTDLFSSVALPGGFEEVEHTADWAYHIWAPDYVHLFLQAARGLYALLGAEWSPEPGTTRRVKLQGVDYESLLIAWLNELLFYRYGENLGFNQIDITHLAPTCLEATLGGSPITQWSKDIKAATYHNLAITPTDDGVEATIVLDV
ncbi:MAG TPA: archease [Leptolyngbyaceae cyanobacterium M65_K2018_010]|nr:archease [Leptolyngbyaceae cyanobacterium M65_K2018_010]